MWSIFKHYSTFWNDTLSQNRLGLQSKHTNPRMITVHVRTFLHILENISSLHNLLLVQHQNSVLNTRQSVVTILLKIKNCECKMRSSSHTSSILSCHTRNRIRSFSPLVPTWRVLGSNCVGSAEIRTPSWFDRCHIDNWPKIITPTWAFRSPLNSRQSQQIHIWECKKRDSSSLIIPAWGRPVYWSATPGTDSGTLAFFSHLD